MMIASDEEGGEEVEGDGEPENPFEVSVTKAASRFV